LALLLAILVGSTINLPLYRQESEAEVATDLMDIFRREFWGIPLPDLSSMKSGVLSIGGAGVFDGILLCGLFALLLT